jgi:hypothetical protein
VPGSWTPSAISAASSQSKPVDGPGPVDDMAPDVSDRVPFTRPGLPGRTLPVTPLGAASADPYSAFETGAIGS